ncbi:MAG: ABC transporter ATP-binding protein/permease [Bacilli bacterium]|nr:ABC transporter ATP-binding protein/permease [Bacilli bacterium]
MIELKNINKIYKSKRGVKTEALKDISMKLPDKGLYFILGKSGSGKSTLLNILGGLDKYNNGEFIIDNKSTKKFKSKDFDYYRNTYIGFIFQEFNLIEEYNVYDNILLSTKLQNKDIDQEKIDELLLKVGIDGLGKRRINELSGGQKQRVAIARALIKEPEIILADEPTGSLDQETGRQIFNLLKEISKEKLVIIISHDRDSAKNYSDHIIEIEDGRVISTDSNLDLTCNKEFKAIKSKLPFLPSIKFALLNLNNKKVKLFFTILLLFMSLLFFGTSKILTNFDTARSHANVMIDNKEEYISINKGSYEKYSKTWYRNDYGSILTDEDINYIDKNINSKIYNKYNLNEYNESVGLDINYKDFYKDSSNTAYYTFVIPTKQYIIEADKSVINSEIIGNYPKEIDEVMIHSYLADYIMESGISLYKENQNLFTNNYYYPTSYEDLISKDRYYTFGSKKVKISGIILDNTKEFEILKTIKRDTIMNDYQKNIGGAYKDKYNTYKLDQTVARKSLDIYVKEGFIDNINLNKNESIDTSKYNIFIINKNEYYLDSIYSLLNKEVSYFNGTDISKITNLNNDEIIINEEYLEKVYEESYKSLKEDYLKNNPGLEEEFFLKYIKENNIINSIVKIKFSDNNNSDNEKIVTLKIVGAIKDSSNIYLSDNIISKYLSDNKELNSILVKTNDKKELINIFNKFPIEDNKYMSTTIYAPTIYNINNMLTSISIVAFYASILFAIFAFFLLTSFIINSIYYSKKNIGILRALGARKTDVFKIFLNEGLIIGIISLILSIIAINIIIFISNKEISSMLFFNIKFITFSIENLLLLIGSVLVIIYVSSLFTVRKIAKMNPVDAILNK